MEKPSGGRACCWSESKEGRSILERLRNNDPTLVKLDLSGKLNGSGRSKKDKEDKAADSVKWTVEDCNGSKAVCCGKRMPSEIHLQVGKEQSNVISAAAAEGAHSVKINQCVVRL